MSTLHRRLTGTPYGYSGTRLEDLGSSEYTLVGICADRDFQRYRIRQIVENIGVEGDANDQDAMNEGGKKQHRRQPIRRFRCDELNIVDRSRVHSNAGHILIR